MDFLCFETSMCLQRILVVDKKNTFRHRKFQSTELICEYMTVTLRIDHDRQAGFSMENAFCHGIEKL